MSGDKHWVRGVAVGAALASLALAGEAAAQQDVDLPVGNPEAGTGSGEDETSKKLETEFSIRSEVHSFDNLDLRALDESSDQAIIDSDDRHTFAYSSISAFFGYQVHDEVKVNVGVSHNGLWSEDQLGLDSERSGALFFSHLNFTYTPIKNDDFSLSFTAGRQPFRIGGVPRDYILDDLLDALVVEVGLGAAGGLRILALDFFAENDLPRASFVRYVSGRNPVLGLRGDTYTLRSGAVYENDKLVDGLDVKAYGFYADIGGGPIDESGADISFGGSLGNFSDNDFVTLFGARASYELKLSDQESNPSHVLAYGEFAHSQGIDRKEVVARDVEINGNAFGGGVEVVYGDESWEVMALGEFYLFDGPDYAGDGLEFERGFVGFKGRRVGGLNLDRYAGWYPAAFTGSGGVHHDPHGIERASGTQLIHGGLALRLADTTVRGDIWLLADTGSTFLDPAELDSIDPPFGYSREEFFAETRLGKSLGTEIDVQLNHVFNEVFSGYAVFGTFLPGEFYEIEINKVAGTALGSKDPQTFWAVTAGGVVSF